MRCPVTVINKARRQTGGSHIFWGAKGVTVFRPWSGVNIFLFKNTFTRDPCCDQLDIPGTNICFRSSGPLSACASPILLSDNSSCYLSWGSRAVHLSSGSAACVCCYRGLRLSGSTFDIAVVASSGDCF